MNDIIFLQDNFFLFKGLKSDEIEELLTFSGASTKEFSPKEIIQDKENYDCIGLIVSGKAFIKSGINGAILNKLNTSSVYGGAAIFKPPTHSTIVEAVTKCKVFTFSKEFIENCISKNHQTSLNYINFLAEKIDFLNNKINYFAGKSSESKLYCFLNQLPKTDNYAVLSYDMSTIAKMLGIGRATLYRAFEKLESDNLITKKDKIIIFNEV